MRFIKKRLNISIKYTSEVIFIRKNMDEFDAMSIEQLAEYIQIKSDEAAAKQEVIENVTYKNYLILLARKLKADSTV